MLSETRAFPERVVARVPPHFPRLVAQAAARQFISPAAFVRQAVTERLARDGFAVETTLAPTGPSRSKAA
jgi:hypothetical protein